MGLSFRHKFFYKKKMRPLARVFHFCFRGWWSNQSRFLFIQKGKRMPFVFVGTVFPSFLWLWYAAMRNMILPFVFSGSGYNDMIIAIQGSILFNNTGSGEAWLLTAFLGVVLPHVVTTTTTLAWLFFCSLGLVLYFIVMSKKVIGMQGTLNRL